LFVKQKNGEVNLSEKKKMARKIGAPVADNQKVMTAGPGSCAKKMM